MTKTTLNLIVEELIDNRLSEISLKELTDLARETLEHDMETESDLDVIEAWEELTGRKIDELES